MMVWSGYPLTTIVQNYSAFRKRNRFGLSRTRPLKAAARRRKVKKLADEFLSPAYMLVMSAIIGSEKTVDEQEKNFLTEAEIEKFLRSLILIFVGCFQPLSSNPPA